MYANANNGSANSNSNNGVRLAINTINRLYRKSLRDGEYLMAKEPSLGNSSFNIYPLWGTNWKAGTSQGAA